MYLFKCPVPSCDHVAEHITLRHIASHGHSSRRTFVAQYGEPSLLNTRIDSHVLRWVRAKSTAYAEYNFDLTSAYRDWARG